MRVEKRKLFVIVDAFGDDTLVQVDFRQSVQNLGNYRYFPKFC